MFVDTTCEFLLCPFVPFQVVLSFADVASPHQEITPAPTEFHNKTVFLEPNESIQSNAVRETVTQAINHNVRTAFYTTNPKTEFSEKTKPYMGRFDCC